MHTANTYITTMQLEVSQVNHCLTLSIYLIIICQVKDAKGKTITTYSLCHRNVSVKLLCEAIVAKLDEVSLGQEYVQSFDISERKKKKKGLITQKKSLFERTF